MDSTWRDLLDLIIRWVHLIAGIMWVGNSMLFNWLDRNLVKKPDGGPLHVGEIWMLHSGGFYQVEKKFLAPGEMPAVLHWFKWQAYTTWITGICLLCVVYYLGGDAYMVDPSVLRIKGSTATMFGLGMLAGTFLLYDVLWRSALGRNEETLTTWFTVIIGAFISFLATKVLAGRAAYIHVGATIGTIMAGNVFFHIMPSQRGLVAATEAGRPQDLALSNRAKQRSIHNNYLTFPLLFLMISNHFPNTYGAKHSWLTLAVLIVGGATARHFMNIRFTYKRWGPAFAATVLGTIVSVFFLTRAPAATAPTRTGPRISYSEVEPVLAQRCLPCHSARPTDNVFRVAPNNVMFDTPEQVRAYAPKMYTRAVVNRTMPFGNKTGMTDDERALLANWYASGAPVD